MKRELIVTRLSHRLGLRQETVWARLSELQKERRLKQQEAAPGLAQAFAERTTVPEEESAARSAVPGPKAGPAVAAEKQLVEILLADPGLVPKAAAAMAPDELTHSGLRRILSELYRSQAAGAVPDLDWLREQLLDRPDLFDAVIKLQHVGQEMQEREQWLGRLLKRFAEMKVKAEERSLKDQLAASSGSNR